MYTHMCSVCYIHCRKTKCERSTSHHSRNVFEHTRTMIPLKSFVYMVHFFEARRWGYRWKILRNTIFTDFCIDLFINNRIVTQLKNILIIKFVYTLHFQFEIFYLLIVVLFSFFFSRNKYYIVENIIIYMVKD